MFSSVFGTSESEPCSVFSWDKGYSYSYTPTKLEYVVNHVFFPFYHPGGDHTNKNTQALACAVHVAACAYNQHIDPVYNPYWLRVLKMLENLRIFMEPNERLNKLYWIISQFDGMKVGDIFFLPAPFPGDTFGVIFRKQDHCTLYELLSPPEYSANQRKVTGSYPELAIEVPNKVFDNENFQYELASSLSGMSRGPPTGMLRGVGHAVEPRRITKHGGYDNSRDRSRSTLWFLVKVAIQLFLDRSPLGHISYEVFMLFFMCNLAEHAANTRADPCRMLLHSMSAKILRRSRKLGSSVPQWLCDVVMHTCATLSRPLDRMWQEVQANRSSLSPWHPSQLDLTKDTQLPVPHIHEGSLIALADPLHTPFLPQCHLRGTLNDFLSDPDKYFLATLSHHDDIHIMLYDVERAVAEGIDEWVSCVTHIDEACKQLECLVDRYRSFSLDGYKNSADHLSIMLLTTIELWIALDKLAVKDIPILANYSPEIHTNILSVLLLRDDVSIHRCCRAYQYLLARYTQANPGWSVLSNEFTEQSFPCQFYNNSPHLQLLKVHIENTLPADLLHANLKVVAFELQCPLSFDAWRSVTCQISTPRSIAKESDAKGTQLHNFPELRPFALVDRRRSVVSLYSDSTAPRHQDRLYYASVYKGSTRLQHVYQLPAGPYAHSELQRYLGDTTHTSNEVLAAQANCHPNLPLREFVAFAHLRSGGSLQWLNILRELRGRALDFRHQEVFLLLAQAVAQVGPLDSTGELLWHQGLQEASFCQALLRELETLFVEIGAGPPDGMAISVISLLAGVLVSKSPGDISEQAAKLLGNVRLKTFGWIHDLLLNVRESPTNTGSRRLLRDMAVVCRSTFDVSPLATASHKIFCSVQDIEIALSCAMLSHETTLPASSDSPVLLIGRDRRLSFILEGSLRDAIQADSSGIAVDRAIQMVWPGYRPSPRRWKPLRSPNSRWLVCSTAPTSNRRSQTVHVNLLNGSLLVDGKPVGSNQLPHNVINCSMYRELFGKHDFMVVASDLPEMDFVTMSVIFKHYVHFAVRYDDLTSESRKCGPVIIRAQSEDTGDISELIPREKLQGVLPRSLTEGHVHWLSLSTSVIEIRPIQKPWERSLNNWTVHLMDSESRVTKGGELLVYKQSPTWAMVSRSLRCLDEPENLIVTTSLVDTTLSPRLSIALPRYGLSFFVNEGGNLESRDFKDMVYDEDQSIGTLFGLVNRLILRPKIEVDLISKQILIPYGHLNQLGDSIFVDLPSSGPVTHYTYQVDSELGCLSGTVSLKSRLYLARLHFFTSSGCRPEPLTGRTGVEEAISLIWSAGTQQETCGWSSKEVQSPQVRFALEKLMGIGDSDFEFGQETLLQEAYLFPSEVASVPFSRKGPLAQLNQLLCERHAPNLWARNTFPHHNPGYRHSSRSPDVNPLRQLFSSLQTDQTPHKFQIQYISRLHDSTRHFQTMNLIDSVTLPGGSGKPGIETLRRHYSQCKTSYTESLDIIKMSLAPETHFEQILNQCGQWPRATPYVLFRCLASTSPIKLPESWKKCLISLALLALDVQRARRLLQFALDNLEEELHKELDTEGCDGWDAAEYPDWLLVQLQGNFLIRRVQADVAREIMSPRSGKSTVMQVNIGEGKSSVIIPICAAALADGNQLVRIIVPRSLIPQTLQLLTVRLCGLLNRPIYHLTLFRNDWDFTVKLLQKLVSRCTKECGVVVMQPEHVLSLKLACVEAHLLESWTKQKPIAVVPKQGFKRIFHTAPLESLNMNVQVSAVIETVKQWYRKSVVPGELNNIESTRTLEKSIENGKVKIMRFRRAGELLELQRFLENHARDILDESDEVLRPQLQMIYTIGQWYPFEGSPDRWVIVQQVLRLVERHADLISTPGSRAIRRDSNGPGSFPHIHILQPEGGERLISLIAEDALDGRLATLSFPSKPGLRGTFRKFILSKDVHPNVVEVVERYARQSTIWDSLLLLRGLLAGNILLFALTQRRWRVDYGLDLSSPPRTMLAIPYRAKDVPAETAEFGHPDITILLTCLSYYYRGLSESQLRISFQLLLQQDDPPSEYAAWVEDCNTVTLPNSLRKLSGVNTRSSEQWTTYLVPLFTRNKRAIDLYLAKVVFPNDAKGYPHRIQGSSWDIAEQKCHLVTGFSGTNDAQYLLPSSITEDDPDHLHQTGTNARVLSYLLQPENSSYMVTIDKNGEPWTALELLAKVVAQDPPIRVLLDIGAQILDLSNLQVARAWLDFTPATEVTGAIYFSECDELMVLERNGTTQPLSSSLLLQQLHRCVAYLDDAHTRGTDIKFPLHFRAAVTLGHNVTKDRLAQGCMRMRKLGHGHSVMFFAPHGVDQRIRGLVGKENQNIPVTTAGILHWAIHESWTSIQGHASYWAQRGVDHLSRYKAWSRFCSGVATSEELANAWVQTELNSLTDMYMPCNLPTTNSLKLPRQIHERCESLGVFSLHDVRMEEEQEREISREIEHEREHGVEPLPKVSPPKHFLHPDVITFVKTGSIPSPLNSAAFHHVFATSINDGPAASSELHTWSPYIFATADFWKTIEKNESVQLEGRLDRYLRPVQWVLSGKTSGKDILVLLSPFEADQLIPEISISEHVHLHLYIPRTTKGMHPCDDLRLYSIPPVPSNWTPPWTLIDQLNMFAGQLYLSDFTSYVRLRRFLGVHLEDTPHNANTVVMHDWFSSPDSLDEDTKTRFKGTPLPLVMQLLARRGTSLAETHMSRILAGQPLTEEDFSVVA